MKLGPYEVLGEIGRGGMGVVLHARGPDGREVAVKVLKRAEKKHAVPRFDRERRLLDLLGEEAGFVPLLDSGEAPEGPYIVMPLLRGGTLRGRLGRGQLPVEETLALGIALALALGRAHARGIVHRDLKPENVIFREDGRPFVADLGLAKHFVRDVAGASASVSLTRAGDTRGTAGYMPYEQVADSKSAGPRADVFALGAMLHECLTGAPAFEGQSVAELIVKIDKGKVSSLRDERPEVPAWFARAIERALSRDPAARFEDGNAFARALARGSVRTPRALVLALVAASLVLVLGVALLGMEGAFSSSEPAKPEDEKKAQDEKRALEAAALADSAYARLSKGESREALALAERALALDPRNLSALIARGMAKGNLGDKDGELADADRALEIDGRYARAYAARAAARFGKGELGRAISEASRGIELDPRCVQAWHVRGEARYAKGDDDGGIADMSKAIEISPSVARSWIVRAMCRSRKRDHAGAIQDATRAIELAPGDAAAWTVRAGEKEASGDNEGAASDAARAIELDAKNAAAWATRGMARLRLRDTTGAVADLDRAIALDPRNPDAYYHRGVARTDQDPRGAAQDLERFLALRPDDPRSANLRMAIEELKRR
ncbi:protein kinase [bacterium]|nr:protein kinase [bacterium]